MTPGLTFDAERHEYFLGGRRVPGATEAINSIAPHRDCGEWYLQRGSAVHAAVALALNGKLDWTTVDERIKGRVEAIQKFIADVKLRPVLLEAPLASERYRFAGTLDCLVLSEGSSGVTLCDWKGSLSPQVAPQLGAYSILAHAASYFLNKAVAVECHDDGTYKCLWLSRAELRVASQLFLALLTAHNWKVKNNL